MRIAPRVSLLALFLLVSACTQNYKSAYELGNIAINGLPDLELPDLPPLSTGNKFTITFKPNNELNAAVPIPTLAFDRKARRFMAYCLSFMILLILFFL